MGQSDAFPNRWLVVLIAISLFVPLSATTAANEGHCPAPRHEENVGLVCDEPDGLLRVIGPDGEELGTTHGHDPPPEPDGGVLPGPAVAAFPSPVDPLCVELDSTPYAAKVIYATASDGPDRYEDMVDNVRWMVRTSNAVLLEEAGEFGVPILYRVGCIDDVIHVAEAVLPTPNAARSFSTVVNDLRNQGFTEHGTHYWVYYDQPGCSGGVGHVWNDDSPLVNNPSNGNSGAMFAVTFGCAGDTAALIMMHELGHNMGAVQNSAPQTSGGFHCNDGQDIMCYADGGSQSNYDGTVCTDRTHFDCNHEDYFHPLPPAGSYLEGHWNLASDVNRFIQKNTPVVETLSCLPSVIGPNEPATCDFAATAGTPGVHYEIDWDDGSGERVPAVGTVPIETLQGASHAWTTPDQYTVRVTAFDEVGRPSQTGTAVVSVEVCDMDESGELVVGVAYTGLYYVTIARTDLPAHPDCPGEPFTLTADDAFDDFDVCFYDFNTELACHSNPGPEAGTIPADTDRISILYQVGFDGTWRFKAGEAV